MKNSLLCKAYEVGFCAKPMKKDFTLFSPRNNHNNNDDNNNNPHPNIADSNTGEGPSCLNLSWFF